MPNDKDLAVGPIGMQVPGGAIYASGIQANNAISKRPTYLVHLDVGPKSKGNFFVSLDKPELQSGFIQVKGFYTDENSEETIASSFQEMIRNATKEQIVDIFLPWHRIHNIRNLVFVSNKSNK